MEEGQQEGTCGCRQQAGWQSRRHWAGARAPRQRGTAHVPGSARRSVHSQAQGAQAHASKHPKQVDNVATTHQPTAAHAQPSKRAPLQNGNKQTAAADLGRHVGGGAAAALQRWVLGSVPDGQPKVGGFDRGVKVLRAGGRGQGQVGAGKGLQVEAGTRYTTAAGAALPCVQPAPRRLPRRQPPGGCAARCGEAAAWLRRRSQAARLRSPGAPTLCSGEPRPSASPNRWSGLRGAACAQRQGGSQRPAAQHPQQRQPAQPSAQALALRVRYFHTDRQPAGTMLLAPGSCSGSEPPLSLAAE